MRPSFLVPVLLSLPLWTGCHGDKGGGDGGSPRLWDFVNTADPAAFQTELGKLDALTGAAQRAALPATETRASHADAFALLTAAESPAATDCADDVAVFGLRDQGPAPAGNLALADGQSCGDAIRTIKSFYAQALDAAGLATARLTALKPGGVVCGFRAEPMQATPDLAAVAYKLTPLDAPAGYTFEQGLYGAADETRIGYLSVTHARCDAATGDCGAGNVTFDATAETVGNDGQKTLDMTNAIVARTTTSDGQGGAVRTVTTEINSVVNVTGLKAGDTLKAHETATYRATVEGSPAPSTATLDLALEELSPGRLRVTGTVTSGASATPGATAVPPQSFALELRRQGDLCRVGIGSSPMPAKPFDPATLPGTWNTACASGDLGRLGERFANESLAFVAGGAVTQTLTAYDDQECFSGHEAARVTVTGSYLVGPELAPNSDGKVESALDWTHATIDVMLVDVDLVTRFNDERLCDRDDWAVGIPKRFDAGRCYFDLGASALTNTATLKRKNEYVTFLPEPPTRLTFARTSDLTGLHADQRARVDAKGVTFVKAPTP